MRKGIKEALLRVTVIVDHAGTGCSQEVHGHDKAGEKFHLGALPSAAQLYHAFETRWTDQEEAPPEQGAGAALGVVLLGPHKAPLVPPEIHAAQHERAGRAGGTDATGSTTSLSRERDEGRRPAATAILHGLARGTAPQTQPPRSGSRASRWPAQESPAGAGPLDRTYQAWQMSAWPVSLSTMTHFNTPSQEFA